MVAARAPPARWLDSPPTGHLPPIPSTRSATTPNSRSPPPLVVPESPRRGQPKNCRPPIPDALEICLTGDDALPATLIANKWHKPNHHELLVPMLPSVTDFSLVATDVPAVAAGHAPPSMAPLGMVGFSEEKRGKVLPWTEGSVPG
jgi:hypothetical protein